jgi:hypothetical protein
LTTNFKTFLIAGIVIPVSLHVLSPERMPWWPDTASLSVVFGVTAVLAVSKHRKDREMNRRIWMVLKGLGRRVLPRVTFVPPAPSGQRGVPASRPEPPAPERHRQT